MLALLLSPILLTRVASADEVITRHETLAKKLKTFSCLGLAAPRGQAPYKIRVVLDQPGFGLRFEALRGKTRFFSVQKGPRIRQLDFESKMYDDLVAGGIAINDFRLSTTMDMTFPQILVARSIRTIVPPMAKFNHVGTEKLDGVSVDHIVTTNQVQIGTLKSEFWIDNDGFPRQQVETLVGQGEFSRFRLTSYEPLKSVSTTEFQLRIPDGFVPLTLNEERQPLGIGEQFPMESWANATTGAGINLRQLVSKRGGLVLFLGKDSISQSCAKAVEKLKKQGVAVMIVETEPKTNFEDACTNRDPKLVGKIAPSDLPLGMILDGKGINKGMVQGFDRERPAKFIDEVLSLLKTLG